MVKTKSAKLINKYVPVSLWKRFIAYLIDVIVVNLVVSLPFYSFLSNFKDNPMVLFTSTDSRLTFLTFVVVISILIYFSVLEYKIRQTLGKIIMGIYVVSLSDKELRFSQALLRNITKPFSIVLLVDVVYMFFKGGNQRLFEVFSRTAVVEKEMIVRWISGY